MTSCCLLFVCTYYFKFRFITVFILNTLVDCFDEGDKKNYKLNLLKQNN
jgi:hypothetical protein